MSLSDLATTRRLLACADLLASTEALAHYAAKGTPLVLSPGEDAGVILTRLVDSVDRSDLPGGYGPLWAAACRWWTQGQVCVLEQAGLQVELDERDSVENALRFIREHGMDIPLYAPVAARKVVALRQALDGFSQAQAAAVKAIEEADRILQGVSGIA